MLERDDPPGERPVLRAVRRPGGTVAIEDEVLGIFVDIISLFRRSPVDDELEADRRSSEEYLFDYLRDLGARGDGLPEQFVEQLRTHPGPLRRRLASTPTPQLETALYRIARSHARMAGKPGPSSPSSRTASTTPAPAATPVPPTCSTGDPGDPAPLPGGPRHRREINYQVFDMPFLDEIRSARRRRGRPAPRSSKPTRTARSDATHVEALVDCPQPLKPLLSSRFDRCVPSDAADRARGDDPPLLPDSGPRGHHHRRGRRASLRLGAVRPRGTAASTSSAPTCTTTSFEGSRRRSVRCSRPSLAGARRRRRLLRVECSRGRQHRRRPGTAPDRSSARRLGDLALRRIVVAISGPETGPRRRRPQLHVPARRARRLRGRGRVPRPPPDDGQAARAVAPGQVRHRRLPTLRTSTCSTVGPRTTPATSGCSRSPRSATSPRCAMSRARCSACPSSNGCTARCSGRSATSRPGARAHGASSGTGSSSTCGRPST